jgi:hypothetical protein
MAAEVGASVALTGGRVPAAVGIVAPCAFGVLGEFRRDPAGWRYLVRVRYDERSSCLAVWSIIEAL